VAKEIGPIAKPKDIRFGDNLPKTRSGKIMRRLLRSIAKGEAITQDTVDAGEPGDPGAAGGTAVDLADKAEASRFTELRNFLEAQENKHMAQNADRQAAMLARLDQLETAVRLRSDQTDNTVAAHIGQLEDRIERRPLPLDINPQA
jgi:hypothetical protein